MPGQNAKTADFLLHKIKGAELKLCETLHKRVVLAFCLGILEYTFLCRVTALILKRSKEAAEPMQNELFFRFLFFWVSV